MKKESKQNQTDIPPISESGKLAVLASAITTIGFGLGTIADALALEEAAQEKQQQQQQSSTTEIERLEQKIDQLMYEMKQMRKQMR